MILVADDTVHLVASWSTGGMGSTSTSDFRFFVWCWGLNQGPCPCQASALPLCIQPLPHQVNDSFGVLFLLETWR